MANPVTPEIYGVILFRTDGNHITIEVDSIEKAYATWAQYRDKWTEALHNKKPLEVAVKEQGILTAFDPVFVYEIIVRKKDVATALKAESNPYYKEMLQNGFSKTLNNKGINNGGSDILDQGYSR